MAFFGQMRKPRHKSLVFALQNPMAFDVALGFLSPESKESRHGLLWAEEKAMSKFFGICAAEPLFFVDMAPFGMAPPNPMNRGVACFGLKGEAT